MSNSGIEKTLLSWSGGKDSAMTLYELQKDPRYEVTALVTTVTEGYERISMHGVRRSLLHAQAQALGVPLHEVRIPPNSSNVIYETRLEETLRHFQSQGVQTSAFGDLFLEDIKAYREKNLAKIGMKGLFPVWKRDTQKFAREFLNLGFRAILVCIDPRKIDPKFAGAEYDEKLLEQLPPHADPCGENGEFHTFVYDGPIFKKRMAVKKGGVVERDNFWFCDLVET